MPVGVVFIRPVPELGDTLLVDGRPAVVVSLLPCRRRYEATARYAYDLPCSRCGAPLGCSVLIQRWWCNGCRVTYGRDALAEAGARAWLTDCGLQSACLR